MARHIPRGRRVANAKDAADLAGQANGVLRGAGLRTSLAVRNGSGDIERGRFLSVFGTDNSVTLPSHPRIEVVHAALVIAIDAETVAVSGGSSPEGEGAWMDVSERIEDEFALFAVRIADRDRVEGAVAAFEADGDGGEPFPRIEIRVPAACGVSAAGKVLKRVAVGTGVAPLMEALRRHGLSKFDVQFFLVDDQGELDVGPVMGGLDAPHYEAPWLATATGIRERIAGELPF